jgi:hypothetical protein
MGTDGQNGTYQGGEWSQEQFIKIMGEMMKTEPKDVTNKEKLTPPATRDNGPLTNGQEPSVTERSETR